MDVRPRNATEEKHTFTVLVTGANSGLGFAICCRLIDEFLYTRPQTQTLHLLFSTRDARKSEDTERRLREHLQRTLRGANGKTLGISLLLEGRIRLEGVRVDLLKLTSVKALAEELVQRDLIIDAVVWNAGIAGWTGINWPKAVWMIITDLIHATTYPNYPVCDVGLATKKQIESRSGSGKDDEPKMGQVFTANVFGHYLLTHWLAPLMHASSRIVWIGSISAVADTFSIADIQGLRATMCYEASKRLTDYLVLTSELPSTKPYVNTFLPSPASSATTTSKPKMYVTHPGICGTSIANVHWIMEILMFAAFYVARFFGSPWHVTEPYKGAVSACFAVLAPKEQLADLEAREGKAKWGSAVGVWGDERVARTAVEGWGYTGKIGIVPSGAVTKSLFRGRKETTKESREEFEEVGRRAWKELEEMRVDWEARLGPVNAKASIDSV